MKLNIGCGLDIRAPYKSGWVNVDLHTGDVMADACALPFRNGTFAQIHAVHVLEHISRPMHDLFYQEMYRVLEPGGELWLEVPSFYETGVALLNTIRNDDTHLPEIKERIRRLLLSMYGRQQNDGDFHYWGFFQHGLHEDLLRNGFKSQHITATQNFISKHYLMEPVILFKGTK